MDWVKIWTFFFFASLSVFACLSIVVTIGGFFDIRSLFKDLSEAKAKAETEQATESSGA
ncbi:MAG: hypothetical protein JSW27_20685 [Phycisphaerales bacterium]|nr:MAG: hypothetical protein JSW27_20685 [Phycisphaerales bacterium]